MSRKTTKANTIKTIEDLQAEYRAIVNDYSDPGTERAEVAIRTIADIKGIPGKLDIRWMAGPKALVKAGLALIEHAPGEAKPRHTREEAKEHFLKAIFLGKAEAQWVANEEDRIIRGHSNATPAFEHIKTLLKDTLGVLLLQHPDPSLGQPNIALMLTSFAQVQLDAEGRYHSETGPGLVTTDRQGTFETLYFYHGVRKDTLLEVALELYGSKEK